MLPEPPWARYLEGASCTGLCASQPAEGTEGKAGAREIGSLLWVGLKVDLLEWAGAEKTRGYTPAPLRALWGRGQDGQPFYCLTQWVCSCMRRWVCVCVLPLRPLLIPERRGVWAT